MIEQNNRARLTTILIVALVLALVSFGVTRLRLTGITKQIHNTQPVEIDVWVSELVATNDKLFRVGDYSNLIIRNRPHGRLQITDVKCTVLPFKRYYFKRLGVEIVDHSVPIEPIIWQCRLRLLDPNAHRTDNGFVSGGNQLKVANRINLEGALYYVDGYIVDLIEHDK